MAELILTIPNDLVVAGRFRFIYQPDNLAAQDIVDHKMHLPSCREIIEDCGIRVEWIRVVLVPARLRRERWVRHLATRDPH